MSKIEVNTVEPQCGTTLTLGASGDTVALASGASQSGFGRSGSVNWQTSIKTADFTAASGEGYFCDTASVGAFTLTLPSSPSVGDIVALKDYASNFATNKLSVSPIALVTLKLFGVVGIIYPSLFLVLLLHKFLVQIYNLVHRLRPASYQPCL